MSLNLLTIIPSLIFEIKKYSYIRKEDDFELLSEFKFNKSIISTYSRIINSKYITDYEKVHLEYLYPQIIDANGENIKDFIVIKDNNIDFDLNNPPNPDSQQLIIYLAYNQHLDNWVNLDSIKILCFEGGGREIFINNQSEHYSPKYIYLLNIEQNHKRKMQIRTNSEKIIIDVILKISKDEKELFQKIITSISLFNESCRLSYYSPNSAVVLVVSALEAILDLPRYSKKDNFSYALKLLYGFNDRIHDWAIELYDLRSQIVHGKIVEGEKLLVSKDRHYPHLKIARDMFNDCLIFVLA